MSEHGERPSRDEVLRRLDEAGREQRATLAAARDLDRAPGDERVGPTLRRLASADAARAREPAPRRRRPWRYGLAAAAALAVLLVLYPRDDDAGTGPGAQRLGGAFELVLRDGVLDGAQAIEWNDAEGRARRFRLRVIDPAREGRDAILVDRQGLSETRWTPDPREVAAWPDRVLVVVEGFDASGASLGTASGSLSR